MTRPPLLPLVVLAAFAQTHPTESVTATATQDRTPRVAVVLSSFTGARDHDGAPIAGLADPRPAGAELTAAQLDALVAKAIELRTTRDGGLPAIVGRDDWVVILTEPGADPRVVGAVRSFLARRRLGKRVTVAEPEDLARAETQEMPAPGGRSVYSVPKMILQCDRLMRVGPLAAARPSLANLEYVDRMNFHPPDYSVLAGPNLVVAGADPLAVASVAAQILGLDPEALPYLRTAADRGLGVWEAGSIWVRGNEIEEARAAIHVSAERPPASTRTAPESGRSRRLAP